MRIFNAYPQALAGAFLMVFGANAQSPKSPEGTDFSYTPNKLPDGVQKAKFDLWLPKSQASERPIRGLLGSSAYQAGGRLHEESSWRDLAGRVEFGCLRYEIVYRTDHHKVGKDDRAIKLILEALTNFAQQTKRPELEHASVVWTGLSQAGWQSVAFATLAPERTVAVVAFHEATPVHQNELATEKKGHAIPQLHVLGGKCFLTPYIQPWVLEARGKGALWSLCLQPGEGHARVGDLTFPLLWLEDVIAQRMPKENPADKPATLKSMDLKTARYGELQLKVEGKHTPYEKLAPGTGEAGTERGRQVTAPKTSTVVGCEIGDKDDPKSVWLPSERVATAWKRYHGGK